MIYPEILAAEKLTVRLKDIFFKDQKWSPSLSNEMTRRFNKLKKVAKPYYPHLSEKTENDRVEFLKILFDYPQQDIEDVFMDETPTAKEGKLCSGQPNHIGAHMAHSMVNK